MHSQQHLLDTFGTEHLHADLKGRSVRGGLVTLTSQGAQFLFQSISTVVLARLLTPSDFGLIAMVTAITGLGQAFADFGLSEATIQAQKISDEQISTIFWINVAIGLTLMLLTVALAPVLAWFYREPRLKHITFLLSLTFLISGLRVQHNALLKRQMRFLSLAIRDVASYILAVPVSIIMAWRGAGYWSLLALPLILNLAQMMLSWLMVRWVPGRPQRGINIGSMVAFGGNLAASYVIYNVNRSADTVLIGWYWGAGPLGLYSRAYNLLMLPVRQLNAPASSVAIPAFSRIQSEPERFARYYLRATNLIMWITTPIFAFLFVAAQPVIIVMLGRQWLEAASVFKILAIAALAQVLLDSTVWLFVSQGQSARLLRLLLFISPVIVGSFVIGLPFSIEAVALSGSLVLVIIFPWILKFTFRGTHLTLPHLRRAIQTPILVCLVAVFLAALVLHVMAPQHVGSQIVVVALVFFITYSLSLISRQVREEAISIRNLLGELGLFRY